MTFCPRNFYGKIVRFLDKMLGDSLRNFILSQRIAQFFFFGGGQTFGGNLILSQNTPNSLSLTGHELSSGTKTGTMSGLFSSSESVKSLFNRTGLYECEHEIQIFFQNQQNRTDWSRQEHIPGHFAYFAFWHSNWLEHLKSQLFVSFFCSGHSP